METIKPITSGYYGEAQKEEIEKLQKYLEDSSAEQQKQADIDATDTEKLVTEKNAAYKTKNKGYETDLDRINREYKERIEKQRANANQVFTEQQAGVGLESQIQAAKGAKSGTLAQSGLAKLSRDISDSFGTSLAEARNNLNTFEQGLDENLKLVDLDTNEKQQMLTALNKVMTDEEAAASIDAIAKKATTRTEYLKMFGAFYSDLMKNQIGTLVSKGEEEQRYVYQKEFWDSLDSPEKRSDWVKSTLGIVIDQEAVAKLADYAKTAGNSADVFSLITKLRKLDEQEKLAYQTAMGYEGNAKDFYNRSTQYMKDLELTPNSKRTADDKVEAPVEVPTDTPAETPVNTPVNTPTETPTNTTQTNTPAPTEEPKGNTPITKEQDTLAYYTYLKNKPNTYNEYVQGIRDFSSAYKYDPTKKTTIDSVYASFKDKYGTATDYKTTSKEEYYKLAYNLVYQLTERGYLIAK